MKLEDQVCSLELAKRLKELGVNRRSLHCWLRRWHDKPYVLDGGPVFETADPEPYFAAYTVSELGELLPPDTASERTSKGGGLCWQIVSEDGDGDCFWDQFCDQEQEFSPHVIHADTEANARAKMLIHCLEKGLVKP